MLGHSSDVPLQYWWIFIRKILLNWENCPPLKHHPWRSRENVVFGGPLLWMKSESVQWNALPLETKVNDKFDTVWSNYLASAQNTMENYASSRAGSLRTHSKTHSAEKSNKCNQCEFSSSQTGDLRRHLKVHSGEKSNKCNQCDYASSRAGHLRRHLKVHSGEKPNKCNQLWVCLFSGQRVASGKKKQIFF